MAVRRRTPAGNAAESAMLSIDCNSVRICARQSATIGIVRVTAPARALCSVEGADAARGRVGQLALTEDDGHFADRTEQPVQVGDGRGPVWRLPQPVEVRIACVQILRYLGLKRLEEVVHETLPKYCRMPRESPHERAPAES